jgi:hypothetical protein
MYAYASQWFLSFSCLHKNVIKFLLFPMLAMCPAHLNLLDFITLIEFSEG